MTKLHDARSDRAIAAVLAGHCGPGLAHALACASHRNEVRQRDRFLDASNAGLAQWPRIAAAADAIALAVVAPHVPAEGRTYPINPLSDRAERIYDRLLRMAGHDPATMIPQIHTSLKLALFDAVIRITNRHNAGALPRPNPDWPAHAVARTSGLPLP